MWLARVVCVVVLVLVHGASCEFALWNTTVDFDTALVAVNGTVTDELLNSARVPDDVAAADASCRVNFPRCMYCVQQPPCVWCERSKLCRHPDALEAEDTLLMLWAVREANTTSSRLALDRETAAAEGNTDIDCGACTGDGSCMVDGCAEIAADALLDYGVAPAADGSSLVVYLANNTLSSRCPVSHTDQDSCAQPTAIVHSQHNTTLQGVVGDLIEQPRKPTLDEWNTCYSYLKARYATPEPYAPEPMDPIERRYPTQRNRADLTQIPCCSLCCCPTYRYNDTREYFFTAIGDVRAFLTDEEFSNVTWSYTADNYTVAVEREFVMMCPRNTSHLESNHTCNNGTRMAGSLSYDQYNIAHGSEGLCGANCSGVMCDPSLECPLLECSSRALACPAFHQCSGGANALKGAPYDQEPVSESVVQLNALGLRERVTNVLAVQTRTCGVAHNDSVLVPPSHNPCSAFDFYTMSLGLSLEELFWEGQYWDDAFVEPLREGEPTAHHTPPADVLSESLSKMLMEDGVDPNDWYLSEESDVLSSLFQKADSTTSCPTNAAFDTATGACVCNAYWSGENCDVPEYDAFCDGLDLTICTQVKELLDDCVVKESDEIDLDCADQGMSVHQCFASGLPFRDRDFDQYNTMNNSVWIRSTNFNTGGEGWVLTFMPGVGVVSSGPVDCNCTGMRCFCSNATYGNVTARTVQEEEVIVSTDFGPNDNAPPSQYGTWHAGHVSIEYASDTTGLDLEVRYHDARVDNEGADPPYGDMLSERGWAEPIALTCNKCVGPPELMNQVCSQAFLEHCHALEGMTRHPVCNLCTDDLVNTTVITSNMQNNITYAQFGAYTTEKPRTDQEVEYQQGVWQAEALATRSDTLVADVQCHLIEAELPPEVREDDLVCHEPNEYCAGLLQAEEDNHPAKVGASEGYKNFGPLRCPHVRHCCMTEVDTSKDASCTLEHTCGLWFKHPYTDCGNRPTGCLPALSLCEFDYDSLEGNAICGMLTNRYNPWSSGRIQNDPGCAAPSWVADLSGAVTAEEAQEIATANPGTTAENVTTWHETLVDQGKTWFIAGTPATVDPNVDASCRDTWSQWCTAMESGLPSDYAPAGGSFCTADQCLTYSQSARYAVGDGEVGVVELCALVDAALE